MKKVFFVLSLSDLDRIEINKKKLSSATKTCRVPSDSTTSFSSHGTGTLLIMEMVGDAIIITWYFLYANRYYVQCKEWRDGNLWGSWTLQDLGNELGVPLGLGYTPLVHTKRAVIRQCRPRIRPSPRQCRWQHKRRRLLFAQLQEQWVARALHQVQDGFAGLVQHPWVEVALVLHGLEQASAHHVGQVQFIGATRADKGLDQAKHLILEVNEPATLVFVEKAGGLEMEVKLWECWLDGLG